MTIETQTRDAVNAVQWDKWMVRHGAEAYQHYAAYGGVMERSGAKAHYISFKSENRDVARAILLEQRLGPITLNHLPRGLQFSGTAAMPHVFSALKRLAAGWRGRFVLLSPPNMAHADALAMRPVVSGESDAVAPIAVEEEALVSQMHQKWRNRFFKAQRSDVAVKKVAPGHPLARWLLEEEANQRRQKRYRALPPALPVDMAREKGVIEAVFVIAAIRGEPVSGASFILNGHHASYFSGVTKPQGRDVCAQHAVLHKSAVLLRERGIQTIDLGVLDTEKSPGLARFKLGFGAKVQRRPGLFLLS